MKWTEYKHQNGNGLPYAITQGYKQAERYWGILGAASGAGQYAMDNKGRTGAVALVTLSVVALTAAYFLSPAYATFVGTVGTKAATLVSSPITTMSEFAVAHPLIASLIVLAAVAALITAPVYVYMNSSKAGQLAKLEKNFKDGCEEVNSGSNNWKFKENTTPLTLLDGITSINLSETLISAS